MCSHFLFFFNSYALTIVRIHSTYPLARIRHSHVRTLVVHTYRMRLRTHTSHTNTFMHRTCENVVVMLHKCRQTKMRQRKMRKIWASGSMQVLWPKQQMILLILNLEHTNKILCSNVCCVSAPIEASQRAIARKASNYYCERAIQSTHDFRSVFEKLLEENGEFGKKIFMNANSERYQVRWKQLDNN